VYGFAENHPGATGLFVWLLIAVGGYLFTRRNLRRNGLSQDWREERHDSWLRLGKISTKLIVPLVLVIVLGLAVAPFGFGVGVLGAGISMILVYPILFVVGTVAAWLVGRDLAVNDHWYGRRPNRG